MSCTQKVVQCVKTLNKQCSCETSFDKTLKNLRIRFYLIHIPLPVIEESFILQ